jgi:hypothetical protein
MITMGTAESNNSEWNGPAKQKFLEVRTGEPFFKEGVAPPTQDATLPANEIRISGRVRFVCTFSQGIGKRAGRRRQPT